MSEQSQLLFAMPSALLGVASVLDFGYTLTDYNRSEDGKSADFYAIRSDWRAVGEDVRASATKFVEEQKRLIIRG